MFLKTFAAAAVLFCALSARADGFRYTVVYNADGVRSMAIFTTSSILTTPTHVTNMMDVAGNGAYGAITSVDVDPTVSSCFLPDAYHTLAGYSCFITNFQSGPYAYLLFAADVKSAGTFTDSPYGYVTITDLSQAATPEPASLLLAASGLLGLGGALRRRLA